MARDNDSAFYASRAQDAMAAKEAGDMDACARVVGQVLLEEGDQGIGHLTDAVRDLKGGR